MRKDTAKWRVCDKQIVVGLSRTAIQAETVGIRVDCQAPLRAIVNCLRPLFTFSNHHVESCGKPPYIDGDVRKRHSGYYENKFGQQVVFVYDHEINEGTLWMGSAGWQKAYKVVDGLAPEPGMGREDMFWLMNWAVGTEPLLQPGGRRLVHTPCEVRATRLADDKLAIDDRLDRDPVFALNEAVEFLEC